jgi:hypothetical protein
MSGEERDDVRDEELDGLLRRWGAPVLPEGLDERMLAAYRRHARAVEPWWARLFTAQVRLPLPVAVGLLVLLVVTAALALRPVAAPPTAGTSASSAPVQAARAAAPAVVTRTSLTGFQPVSEVTATVIEDVKETRQ